jgi:quinol monooxygenase YgiN
MSFRRFMASSLLVLAILTGWVFVVSPARAQEKESPIAARVKAAVKDPAKPFTLIVRFKLKEDATAKFEVAFTIAAKATRQKKGNRAYDLNRDTQTPTQYLLYERWQNLSSLEAHLKTPYITKLLAETGEMMADPPELSVFVPAGG